MYERIKVNTLEGHEQLLDIYEVDKYGNVYGADEMSLAHHDNGKGYQIVSLKYKNKRRWKKCYIHRLVGLAFVEGRTEEKNEIDHKDTNRKNNIWTNLKWCSRTENMNNSITKESMKGINGVECYVYDYLLNYIGHFKSMNEAQKHIGYTIKATDIRIEKYYILSKPDLSLVLKINRKQKIQSIVITDTLTFEKFYFYSNREARRFFDNKVNITNAIQKNWLVKGRYKVRALNYKKLIGMLDL